ncbi:MAG: hypothetical protein R3C56_26590 [Pirellulaceae bacterium]
MVEPQTANAIKFERFVFDLLPLAERAFVVEGDASRVFAPVKNANGAAVDTPDTAQTALLLHRDWLTAARSHVPVLCRRDSSPLGLGRRRHETTARGSQHCFRPILFCVEFGLLRA